MSYTIKRPGHFGGEAVVFSSLGNDRFTVQLNNKSWTVKVKDSASVTFKVNKTCIAACGGANGLFAFMEKTFRDGFMECYSYSILEAIINGNVRAVPA